MAHLPRGKCQPLDDLCQQFRANGDALTGRNILAHLIDNQQADIDVVAALVRAVCDANALGGVFLNFEHRLIVVDRMIEEWTGHDAKPAAISIFLNRSSATSSLKFSAMSTPI